MTGKRRRIVVRCPRAGCRRQQAMITSDVEKAHRTCVYCNKTFSVKGNVIK